MTAPETVEAEVVEQGAEVVPIESHGATLWHTDNPATVLEKATETANALAPILRDKGMLSKIGDKDYVQVEGWQTLGSMLGVTPVGVWTKQIDGGWEAKVNAQTLDGRVIGSAEAMCVRDEANWKDSDEFAIRSMAQTRAASKALASVLRFVVTLAGFSGTPAEEMDGVKRGGGNGRTATEKQKNFAYGLLTRAGLNEEEKHGVKAWSHNANGELVGAKASRIIELLKTEKRSDPIDQTKVAELLREAGFEPPQEVPGDAPEQVEGDPFEFKPGDEA